MNRSRWARRLTVLLLFSIVACIAAAGVLLLALPQGSIAGAISLLVPALAFGLVGTVIALRRPDNGMGWIFVAIGWFMASGTLTDEIANRWAPGDGEPPALVVLSAWYSEWFWIPFIFLSLSLGILLFPTGRAHNRRWRGFVWGVALVAAFLTVAAALDPVVQSSSGRPIENPIGISPLGDPDEVPLELVFVLALGASMFGALLGLVLRFRRSRGEERQQLKWFVYSACLEVSGFAVMAVSDISTDVPLVGTAVLSALPIGAGIAILKYRLYDIDVVINRTLVYAALTAVLVAAYAGGVLLFRTVLAPVTGESDLAVAASTLGVAALFGPARRHIQTFIDRRFYRSRYDAQQTLEGFATRLRDEVDLDALEGELMEVLGGTVQPRHASLWLAGKAG